MIALYKDVLILQRNLFRISLAWSKTALTVTFLIAMFPGQFVILQNYCDTFRRYWDRKCIIRPLPTLDWSPFGSP